MAQPVRIEGNDTIGYRVDFIYPDNGEYPPTSNISPPRYTLKKARRVARRMIKQQQTDERKAALPVTSEIVSV